jgi:hypothetical protein
MPEQHGQYARHTKYQGKGEKIPLFAEKIYVGVPKKFHAASDPLYVFSSVLSALSVV